MRGTLLCALLGGCTSGVWPAGEVCNQRFRIQFAGIESDIEAPDCGNHDYDNDGFDARHDMDDRIDRYTQDPIFDGTLVGDMDWCREDDDEYVVNTDSLTYNEYCVRTYWREELEDLCAAWSDGERYPTFEYDEAEDFETYCPQE